MFTSASFSCFPGRKYSASTQGGNTGLVGGSVPLFDEVVLATGAMNKILSFDPVSSKQPACCTLFQHSLSPPQSQHHMGHMDAPQYQCFAHVQS